MTVRNALSDDLSCVLGLNQKALPHVSSVALGDMRRFLEQAAYFKIIDNQNGGLNDFPIALRPGLDYASDNYRWFSDAFDDFFYIDRFDFAPVGAQRTEGGTKEVTLLSLELDIKLEKR